MEIKYKDPVRPIDSAAFMCALDNTDVIVKVKPDAVIFCDQHGPHFGVTYEDLPNLISVLQQMLKERNLNAS